MNFWEHYIGWISEEVIYFANRQPEYRNQESKLNHCFSGILLVPKGNSHFPYFDRDYKFEAVQEKVAESANGYAALKFEANSQIVGPER